MREPGRAVPGGEPRCAIGAIHSMLNPIEKLAFLLLLAASLGVAGLGVRRIVGVIRRGRGQPDWRLALRRAPAVLAQTLAFSTVFRTRPVTSLLHALVAWGFIYFLLVNLADVLHGFLPGYVFLGESAAGNLFRLGADVLTVGILVGMLALLVRRFLVRPAALQTRETTLLHPKARRGIRRDSAIVGGFILIHVGARFVGESAAAGSQGAADPWMPFASALAAVWQGVPPATLEPPLILPGGWRWGRSCSSCPTSRSRSTSTCSLRRSTSCSSRSGARSVSWSG